MKKQRTLLLLVFLLWGLITAPVTAWADGPNNYAQRLAFGSATPSTPNSDDYQGGADNSSAGTDSGNDTGSDSGTDSGNDTGSGTSTGSGSGTGSGSDTGSGIGSGSDASSSGTDSATAQEGSGQEGGSTTNQLEPDAYATEKSAAQQTIDDATQQYGGPRLSGLSLDAAQLIPIFSSETFSYAAYVAEGTSSVLITAQTATGSVYIDGAAGNTRRVNLSGDEQSVRVIVVEQNQSTTYTLLILRTPNLVQPVAEPAIPYITHIQLSNDEVFYERAISAADGTELIVELPQATTKKVQVEVTVNTQCLVYYNNIRVYNGYYYQNSGYWTWSRQFELANYADNLLGVHLADAESKAVLNYYSIRVVQPSQAAGLRIQLQVGNEQALVNEALHVLDAPPLIMDGGHTVVPLRFIAEALGATVSWQPAEQRVDIQLDQQTLSLFIGKQANGMPLAPFIENDRTMVPLRYVSEQLACTVEWLAATREIIITR